MGVTTDTAQSPDTYRWWLSGGDAHYRLQHLTKQGGFDVWTIAKPFFSQLTIHLKERLIIYNNLVEMEGGESKFLLVHQMLQE